MTTTTQHRKRKGRLQDEQVEREVERRVGRRRAPWRTMAALLALVGFLWFLPGFVAHTPLLNWIVGRAVADLDGSVSIQSASLGWFSPVMAGGIEVVDAKGSPVARVESAQSERSLVGLLTNLSSLGKFRLNKPVLDVVLRADGSNVEDLLAPLLAKPGSSDSIGLSLEIVDGTVNYLDQVHNRAWQIEKLQLDLAMSADSPQLIDLKASGAIVDPQPGTLEVALAARQLESGQFSVSVGSLPLPILDGLLTRWAGNWQLNGRLDTELSGRWGGEEGKTEVQGDLGIKNLAVSGAALGADKLRLASLEATVRAKGDAKRVDIERTSLTCDVAQMTLDGHVDLGKLQGDLMSGLLEQVVEARGTLDIARLAAMLPNTLHIRPQTQLTSGKAELTFSSRRGEHGMTWQGAVEAKDVRAVDQGRPLAWEKPIAVRFDARQSPRGPVVDLLSCESDFLRVNAAGNFDDLAGNAHFNLEKLASQLGQFIDLSDTQLAGECWARGHWKRSATGEFETRADVQLSSLAVQFDGLQRLVEPSVALIFTAKGHALWDKLDTMRVDEAALSVTTTIEQLDAELSAPVVGLTGAWPLKFGLTGKLQNLRNRLAIWLPLEGWQISGDYNLTGAGSASTNGADVREAKLLVTPLAATSSTVAIDEPKVELTCAGAWDRAARRVRVDALTLVSNTAGVRAQNLVVAMPESGNVELLGAVNYQADIARLVQCFVDRNQPRAWSVAGMVVGQANVKPAAGGMLAQLDADVTNLTVTDASGTPITEPRIHLKAQAGYDYATSLLRVERAELSSAALAANVTVSLAQGDEMNLSVQGQIGYDLARVTGLLRPYLGPEIRIVGRNSSPIGYEGPLNPAAARGNAGLSWDSADIFGFPIGKAELKARLSDGWLVVDPVDVEVSGGRMSLAPQVNLAATPAELRMPAGKLADNIQLTPGMCASAMKYAAPVLADVAEAQGAFSIELQGCRIPLNDPSKADIAGRLLIHSIEIGPGPLIRELAIVLGKAVPGRLRRESVVPFRMVNGRVYHQNLELIFPDITVRTQGSVGLDQTLTMLVEMPVPAKWIEAMGNTPVAASLRNQTLQIPLAGTLSRPVLDKKVVDDLSRQFIQNTTRTVVEEELNKQLDRLFRPPK